jgi:hypothetical protein
MQAGCEYIEKPQRTADKGLIFSLEAIQTADIPSQNKTKKKFYSETQIWTEFF